MMNVFDIELAAKCISDDNDTLSNQKYIFTISLRELSVSLNPKKYKNPHANDQIQANI